MYADQAKFRAYQKSMMGRYVAHRANAQVRGIPFRLTFKQWVSIWNGSGKWDKRGTRSDQYCMARPGDRGAYEVGNVTIVLNKDNRAERNRLYSLKGKNNPAFGKDYSAFVSRSSRKRRNAKISAALSGKSKSAQMGKRLSRTNKGRRLIIRDGCRMFVYPGDVDYPQK